MFAEFLNIIFKSLKLDKNLYKNNKNFGEAAIYFAGLIMILDGVAGAVAANTFVKTSIGISGLTAILTWLVWAILIYVVGVKIFPDKESNVPFKKSSDWSWLCTCSRFTKVFCCYTRIGNTNNFSYSILDFCFFNNIN